MEEHVSARLRYGETALVDFYTASTRPADGSQRLHLLFERGEVTLSEWIPTRAVSMRSSTRRQSRELCELFPGARLDVSASYSPKERQVRGRGEDLDVWQMIDLSYGTAPSRVTSTVNCSARCSPISSPGFMITVTRGG